MIALKASEIALIVGYAKLNQNHVFKVDQLAKVVGKRLFCNNSFTA